MNKTIPVVLCSDNNYSIPLFITAASVLKNRKTGTQYQFYFIVSKDFSPCIKNSIENMLSAHNALTGIWIYQESEGNLPIIIDHITEATYYRLNIHKLITENRCIYLDVDTCICDDLSELFSIELESDYLAGVKAPAYYRSRKDMRSKAKHIGVPVFDRYINAGVLLMNLEKMRNNSIETEFQRLLLKRLNTQDQDILNSACFPFIKTIPPKFNLMTKYSLEEERYSTDSSLKACFSKEEWVEALQKPAVIHYASRKKPWMYLDLQLSDVWWDAFDYAFQYVSDYREWSKELLGFFKLTQTRHVLAERKPQSGIFRKVLYRLHIR